MAMGAASRKFDQVALTAKTIGVRPSASTAAPMSSTPGDGTR